jgi:hypothetical protein
MADDNTHTKETESGEVKVDHTASALANLEDAKNEAIFAVVLPFAMPFSELPEGAGLGTRIAGTAFAVAAAPFMAVASAKDLLDAAAHFVAGLSDD